MMPRRADHDSIRKAFDMFSTLWRAGMLDMQRVYPVFYRLTSVRQTVHLLCRPIHSTALPLFLHVFVSRMWGPGPLPTY